MFLVQRLVVRRNYRCWSGHIRSAIPSQPPKCCTTSWPRRGLAIARYHVCSIIKWCRLCRIHPLHSTERNERDTFVCGQAPNKILFLPDPFTPRRRKIFTVSAKGRVCALMDSLCRGKFGILPIKHFFLRLCKYWETDRSVKIFEQLSGSVWHTLSENEFISACSRLIKS
jgi:hypothetical protein